MDLANLLHGAPKPYSETYRKRQAPPSPPVEEPKCSLPSISTLLEGADAQHSAKRQRLSPVSQRYDTVRLPPTPPLRPGSGSGHAHSPSELSSKPVAEHHHQHPHRSSISSTGSTAAIPHVAGPYASPAPSVSSYTSPVDAPQPQQPMYYARPPSTTTFQPATPVPAPPMAQPQAQQPQQPQQQAQPAPAAAAAAAAAAQSPSLITPVTPAWQHHHYFPPSTTTAYQQTHERYICRTCHKAFSRPSSLRIHSHSHTGEKPFRCTHAGCGKAFSVRSNMKRHERGCHSGRPAPAAPVALVS